MYNAAPSLAARFFNVMAKKVALMKRTSACHKCERVQGHDPSVKRSLPAYKGVYRSRKLNS
jgi:hypothetical protein